MRTLLTLAAVGAVSALAGVGAAYLLTRELKGLIMATKDEVIASLQQVNETLNTVRSETTELVAKVAELQEAIDNAGSDVPEEIASLVGEISAKVTAIDELVPNKDQGDGETGGDAGGDAGGENPVEQANT